MTARSKLCTPEQQRHIINLWTLKKEPNFIARKVRVTQFIVNDVIKAYMRKYPPQLAHHQVRADVKAVKYANHDELSAHYRGVEYEDTRPHHLRGLDWPIKGYL